jgi:hypothetical protein
MAEGDAPPEGGAKGKGSFFKKNKTTLMIAGGLVVLLLLYLVMRKSSTSSSAPSTASTTAANGGIDPSTGYLYGSAADLAAQGASGATAGVPGPAGPTGATGATGPAASSPDVYNAQGRDLGQYKYGQDELTYLQGNIGSYGITQAEYNDIAAEYQKILKKYGQAAADAFHYGWSGPGKVSTTNSGGSPGPNAMTAKPQPAPVSTKKTVIQPNNTLRTH